MSDTETLRWEEVEPVARLAFRVWVGQPELRWAKRAWQKIIAAGLASYSNELDYTRAALRFIALACIYNDFCQAAWDEESVTYVGDWWRMFNLSPFRIGQLVGPEFNPDTDDYAEDDGDLIDLAMDNLLQKARSEVADTLIKSYNGAEWLIVSLHHSNEATRSPSPVSSNWADPDSDDEEDALDDQSINDGEEENNEEEFTDEDAELLIDASFASDYLQAYDWILAGCPDISSYR